MNTMNATYPQEYTDLKPFYLVLHRHGLQPEDADFLLEGLKAILGPNKFPDLISAGRAFKEQQENN